MELTEERAPRRVRQEPSLITVAAGDLIGASPRLPAAFHDAPTIEASDMMGLQVAPVGNHELRAGAS